MSAAAEHSRTPDMVVFGSTGRCGAAMVSRALAAGYRVRAVARSASKLERLGFDAELERGQLSCQEADIRDPRAVAAAIDGVPIVVSGLASFEPPHDQMSTLTRHVVSAAKPGTRYVVFGLCNRNAPEVWLDRAMQACLGVISRGKFGPAMLDHDRQEALLRDSELDYTIAQTASMRAWPMGRAFRSGGREAVPDARLWQRFGYLDAAEAVIRHLEDSPLPRLYFRYC